MGEKKKEKGEKESGRERERERKREIETETETETHRESLYSEFFVSNVDKQCVSPELSCPISYLPLCPL